MQLSRSDGNKSSSQSNFFDVDSERFLGKLCVHEDSEDLEILSSSSGEDENHESQALALTRNCKSPPFSSTPVTTERISRESPERGPTPPTSLATPLNTTASPSSVKEEFDASRSSSETTSRITRSTNFPLIITQLYTF
ncbi:hypothetical protein HHI36_023195 [Cryptolaemus montrouzieri]|uniref:Uncharacterized protein n=1 Tax=Cryptolaemus montrouzieri TaxID=559131 RepID=A0ABD2PG46_9CUCU